MVIQLIKNPAIAHVRLDQRDLLDQKDHKEFLAVRAPKGLLDEGVILAHRAILVALVQMDPKAILERWDQWGRKDLGDHAGILALWDAPDRLVRKGHKEKEDLREHPELLAPKDHKDHWDLRDHVDHKVVKGRKDHKGKEGIPVLPAAPDLLDLLVRLERLLLLFLPNTNCATQSNKLLGCYAQENPSN